MNVRRHRPAGIVPLEVWDVVVDGTPLHLQPASAQPAAIAAIVRLLREGAAIRNRGAVLPALPIARVVVAGGGAIDDVVAAMVAVGIDARAAIEPVNIGRAGGLQLAHEVLGIHDDVDALVADVGQTSIKWFVNDRNERIARPAELLLEVDARSSRDDVDWRAHCVEFIAGAIRSSFPYLKNNREKPAAIVLALPCEIDSDDDVTPTPPLPSGRGGRGVRQGSGTAGLTLRVAGCSYPWPDHDPHLIADIVAAADVADVPAIVLNDAELAAVSIRAAGAGTLVLTIGLGVGGAFIAR